MLTRITLISHESRNNRVATLAHFVKIKTIPSQPNSNQLNQRGSLKAV